MNRKEKKGVTAFNGFLFKWTFTNSLQRREGFKHNSLLSDCSVVLQNTYLHSSILSKVGFHTASGPAKLGIAQQARL